MKKIITKIILAVVVFGGLATLGWFIFNKTTTPSIEDDYTVTELEKSAKKTILTGNVGTTESHRKEFGKSDSLQIKNFENVEIIVPNFYRGAAFINKFGDADLVVTDGYIISYLPEYSVFLILLTNDTPRETRKDAEAAFINLLHIDKNQACNLDVRVAVHNDYNQDGQYNDITNLSFCPPRS